MSRCTQCGASIKSGSTSCEYCGAHVDAGELESVLGFHEASNEFKGHDYRDVKADLQAAGFTSVEAIAVPDLTTGWWKEPDEVKEVSINGRTDFSADDDFPTDAKIVIRYHAFP